MYLVFTDKRHIRAVHAFYFHFVQNVLIIFFKKSLHSHLYNIKWTICLSIYLSTKKFQASIERNFDNIEDKSLSSTFGFHFTFTIAQTVKIAIALLLLWLVMLLLLFIGIVHTHFPVLNNNLKNARTFGMTCEMCASHTYAYVHTHSFAQHIVMTMMTMAWQTTGMNASERHKRM